MLHDLLKHQSLSKICSRFVRSISNKYNNKITVGEYIVERFIDKKINIGFSSKNNYYMPFSSISNKYSNFDIVFSHHEESTGHCALSYAKHTNNIGLIISTSTCGFTNICKTLKDARYNNISLLLMSFYDPESESKLPKLMKPERRYLKESYTVNKSEEFAKSLEYMMMMSELPQKGPVHLNICNNILKKKVNMDDISPKNDINLIDEGDQTQNRLPDADELSLLQYFEKKYEEAELHEQESKNKKT